MEYYSAIKCEDILSFAGKLMELENILSEVIQTQKGTHEMYSLISGYCPKKFIIPKIECTELKKVNKLKCRSKDNSVQLEREKKQSQVERKGGTWKGKWTRVG